MYNLDNRSSEFNILTRIRSINFFFLFIVIIIFLFGVLSLNSVSNGDFNSWPIKHIQRFLLGLIVFFTICAIDIKFFLYLHTLFFY